MMRAFSIFLALCMSLVSMVSLSSAAANDNASIPGYVNYGPTIKKITRLAKAQMKENNVVGLGIALVDGQKVVWQQGFGYADKAGKVAATADTIFEAGSISKPFTATALMQLVEQGKVEIDRPASRYVRGFDIQSRIPGADASLITPRLLMSNHSGIPFIAPALTGYSFRPEAMENVSKLLRHDWLAARPNTIYSYSNLGAGLAGLIVERVSGQDFITYTDRHIFAPLNMKLSSFEPKSEMEPYLSKSYGSAGEESTTLYVNYPPAGSLLSSASEMTHFMKAMLADGQYQGRSVIKPATLKEMWTPQNEDVALDFDYRVGLYWILTDADLDYAGKVASFSGDTAFQHSRMILLPDCKLGAIVFTNSKNGSGVARTVAVAALQSAVKAKVGLSLPPYTRSPMTIWPASLLKPYAGLYAGIGGVAKISVESGHLLVETFPGFSYKLVPLADGKFAAIGLPGMDDSEYSFETVGDHKVLIQVWRGHKMVPFLSKITLPKPRQAWINRIGDYTIEMAKDYYPFYQTAKLIEHKGVLTLIVNGGTYYALKTVDDNNAVIQGLGTYLGETVRIEQKDGVERLYFQNYAFRKTSG